MNQVGVGFLCKIGLPPPDLIFLAAQAGCGHVSIILRQPDHNPFGYPAWSLIDDRALRRETVARARDAGIEISLGEGCSVGPNRDVSELQQSLEIFAEMGVEGRVWAR